MCKKNNIYLLPYNPRHGLAARRADLAVAVSGRTARWTGGGAPGCGRAQWQAPTAATRQYAHACCSDASMRLQTRTRISCRPTMFPVALT